MDWFRSWHGAPTDNKWLVIGRKAGVSPGIVSAVVWALFDYASQNDNRGSIENFDIETYSAFSGFEEAQVGAVVKALIEKEIIQENKFISWGRRQPKHSDNSTDRVRKHRDMKRNETDVTAHETICNTDTEEIRLDTEKKEEIVLASADASADEKPKIKSEKGKRLKAYLAERDEDSVGEEFGTWALKELGLSAELINAEMQKFCDYWNATPGQRGVKLDWPATWRNWMRKVKEAQVKQEKINEVWAKKRTDYSARK